MSLVKFKTFTYAPEVVFALVGGLPILTFNSIEVKYDRPRWAFYEGTRGEITRGGTAATLGTIRITIPRTSPFNDAIFLFYSLKYVIPVIIKDGLGASLHTMLRATIVEAPEVIYNEQVTETVWEFKGLIDINLVGGSYV